MWYHHPEEFEPLLPDSTTDLIRQVATRKEISESIHREQSILGSKFRSTSLTRWYMLFGIGLSWFATYFNSIYHNEISDNDYSYIISITYIMAVFTPLFIPRILLFFNGSSMMSLICIQFISLSGSILLYLGGTSTPSLSNVNIILLYIGRIFNGIALGCNDTIILSILIFWFSKSQNMSFSSTFICISILIARLCLELMSSASMNSSYFVSIPIVINFISIWILFAINCIKNKNVPPIYDEMILRDFYDNGNIWNKYLQIPHILWLIILNLSFLLAMIHILYGLFLPNVLLTIYNFSQNESFILLILSIVFIILWSLPTSYIMDIYGYHIQWNICSSFLFFLSLLLLFFGANNKVFAILSLSIISISILFISSYFTLTILTTKPIEFAPYIATIISILHWSFYLLFNYIISYFEDQHTLFILIISFIQFIISAIIYGITVKSNLNLHNAAPTKEIE